MFRYKKIIQYICQNYTVNIHTLCAFFFLQLLSSNMEQKGNDDEGILGFLTEDIQKELRRGKRLVYNLKTA